MGNSEGAHSVVIPRRMMEEIVLPKQRRIYEETGKLITTGLVVRQLLELGHAQDISQRGCLVSSSSK